jgi:hypothetical protein
MTATSPLMPKHSPETPWKKGKMKAWLSEHMVIPGRANYRPCERRKGKAK